MLLCMSAHACEGRGRPTLVPRPPSRDKELDRRAMAEGGKANVDLDRQNTEDLVDLPLKIPVRKREKPRSS